MSDDFAVAVESLVRKAPLGWLTSACGVLRSLLATSSPEYALQRLPATANADAAYLMNAVVRVAWGKMSWEALSWALQTASIAFQRFQAEQHIELLWSGPAPANQLPARRIDQALYDLIANAKREILMVTFAAAKIERLTRALWSASQTGVRIRLILEFEESSEGQLSYDALRAFPAAVVDACEIYQWPVEKRERNQAGRPGKLHAKVAIVDDKALISSANLTDDAFTRNFEIGLLVENTDFLTTARAYIDSLIAAGTLSRLYVEH